MKQKNDSAKRATLGKLSGLVGIVCNVCLAGSKLAVGKLAGSMSITADGLNNLSDAFDRDTDRIQTGGETGG